MTGAPQYQVKLLAALRSGDPALIHPFLAEINKERHRKSESISISNTLSPDTRRSFQDDSASSKGEGGEESLDTAAAALHLAIRCASADTISLLLAHRAISPNGVHPASSLTTPLHLAASLGRLDVITLLLDQPEIDDTVLDADNKSARDIALLAKHKDIVRAIDDSRTLLNARFRSLLRSYILAPPQGDASAMGELLGLLQSPRSKWVDVSYIDDDSGTSLLHEAARRKDLRMIESAVKAGADVFVRDRKGRTAYEGSKGDDRAKAFLKQLANHDTSLLLPPPSHLTSPPPPLKGYLNKYTNVAKGYSTRWFVLADGYLSYFRRQEDEAVASRGSISLRTASIRYGSSSSHGHTSGGAHGKEDSAQQGQSLRFEIHPGTGSGSAQKWYIRANHPIEAGRWVRAIEEGIEWYRRQAPPGHGQSASTTSSYSSSPHSLHRADSTNSASNAPYAFPSGAPSSASLAGSVKRSVKSSIFGGRKNNRTSSMSYTNSAPSNGAGNGNGGSSSMSVRSRTSDVSGLGPGTGNGEYESDFTAGTSLAPSRSGADSFRQGGSPQPDDGPVTEAEPETDEEEDSELDGEGGGKVKVPHEHTYELELNALQMQMELTLDLSSSTTNSQGQPTALTDALSSLSSTLTLTLTHTRAREAYFRRALRREKRKTVAMEEGFATLVKEGEELEGELRKRARSRGGPKAGTPVRGIFEKTVVGEKLEKGEPTSVVLPTRREPAEEGDRQGTITPAVAAAFRQAQTQATSPPPAARGDDDAEDLTDEEDEFFDAIELGSIPGLVVPQALRSPAAVASDGAISPAWEQHLPDADVQTPKAEHPKGKGVTWSPDISDSPASPTSQPTTAVVFQGSEYLVNALSPTALPEYTQLRPRLKIGNDSRPAVSLWSVLRHNIGKDLTKISFPVSFNEPTSMLQRMAEDMEFSECLNAAAEDPDQFMRIAFVAAFAMSNYSSTIGRIAKPFNPMLSETFEYCRPDRQYRYISEQVSHHPPISACWSESPLWRYFGEVDAQNKFMGKSFEIRPTGVAHAELVLPADAVEAGYPRFGQDKEKVLEHYTWKKVTTNVSGFILGSPTIDHYGDMEIVNHRTGDRCILTFKPRGWRGKDAYEIIGHVQDASRTRRLDIAGRWNSQLVCQRSSATAGGLHPDVDVPTSKAASADSVNPPTLLWRNSKKPEAPFNLTPFAITLNDLPEGLKGQLPPTDCRVRPDQRAFEEGRYEEANLLKIRQEERQRAIRKEREEGKRASHKPRWFSAETDRDTGERVWTPARVEVDGEERLEYWVERARVRKEARAIGQGQWKEVDDIFIEG